MALVAYYARLMKIFIKLEAADTIKISDKGEKVNVN